MLHKRLHQVLDLQYNLCNMIIVLIVNDSATSSQPNNFEVHLFSKALRNLTIKVLMVRL